MLGLYPGSGKLPSGDITVEVWEYSQKKTWDCRWRFGGKRDSSSNKVLFTDAVSRVPTLLGYILKRKVHLDLPSFQYKQQYLLL
jgi:hypothetical protein